MNKIVVGLLFGLILGAIDGATAWFTPEARPMIGGILVGSSIKGMLVGLLGLLFAFLVAAMQKNHYLEIMLPGFVLGGVIGFLTQRIGTTDHQVSVRPQT